MTDDQPNHQKCNYDFIVGKTTPIGSYPDGAAPMDVTTWPAMCGSGLRPRACGGGSFHYGADGRGDLGVWDAEGTASELALSFQGAPAFGDRLGDGQDATGKQAEQIRLEPRFELGSPLPGRHDGKSFSQLAETDDAEIEALKILGGKPSCNLWFRQRSYQL